VFDGEAHVAEAFRCGGQGYVVKTRAARDLPTALRQAHRGLRFAPSLASMCELSGAHGHVMQVHAELSRFLDELAAVLDLALRRGDATCVISTADIRDSVGARLRARGWDVGGAEGERRYLPVDAAEALSRFMRNGLPDAGLLAPIAAEIDDYRRSVGATRLTIFGNISEQLIAGGNFSGALAVERLWHTLTRHLPFCTVCGYDESSFDDTGVDFRPRVCAEHDIVSHAAGA